MTLVPLTERSVRSSSPRSKFLSFSVMFPGTEDSARLAKMRSMLMPIYSNLMIGTKASGTGVISSIAPCGECFSRTDGNVSKKSSLDTSFGTTTSVSISEPGRKVNHADFKGSLSIVLTWPVDTQSIAAIRVYLATSCRNYSWWKASLPCHDFFYELHSYLLKDCQYLHPVVSLATCSGRRIIGTQYLRSVSVGDSKFFCRLSSSTSASLTASSASVGIAVDIAGVTPFCWVKEVAMVRD